MDKRLNHFGSIESSHEYVSLLVQAIDEAAAEVEENMRASLPDGGGRRLEALQLVAYTLKRLREHIATSRRLLNNLRTLRNLVLAEHAVPPPPAALPPEPEPPATEFEIYR
jgi:hypothetical protein